MLSLEGTVAEDLTFDIYRLMVEEVRDAKRARRELSNTFMTLNLAGIGALGFLARGDAGGQLDSGLFGLCALALGLTCLIWQTSNTYYTHMLAQKYKTIYGLEDKLGTHPIKDEWMALHGKRSALKWFTLERAMPMLFVVGYVVFFLVQSGIIDLGQAITDLSAATNALIARFSPR